jgi:hypothetical protein
MKNIQIDGADNATFGLFPATDEEFAAIFPGDQDIARFGGFSPARCGCCSEPIDSPNRPSGTFRRVGLARG